MTAWNNYSQGYCWGNDLDIFKEFLMTISSNIKSHSYDEPSQKLTIEFHSSGIYHYENVPKDKYEQFTKAPSLGKYFHTHIKNKHKVSKQ